MDLEAWLRQRRPLAERLHLVERLAQALNAVHDRGEVLGGLAPDRVEVGSDLRCDLSAARKATPEPGYAAPERLEGGPPTSAADVYSAGALAWEVLVGRPCGERPVPLGDVAPDVPEELANAVMGCLERSPQWRPRDLTYLAQLAAAHQKPPRRGPETVVAPTPARATATPRTPPRRPSRSHLPLVLAALLLVAAAAGSYWWLERGPAGGPGRPAASTRPPRAAPTSAPPPTAAPAPRVPAAAATVPPDESAAAEGEAPAATPPPAETAPPDAPGEVPPATTAVPAAAPVPRPTPTPVPTPTPPPNSPPVTAAPAAAEVAAPREPVVLTALSPLTVRRPGKVLLDLRGTGLRPDLSARVLPLREAPRGIAVGRQKWVSPTLITVLLELDETAAPGTYALVLEDASGRQTKPLSFSVTK